MKKLLFVVSYIVLMLAVICLFFRTTPKQIESISKNITYKQLNKIKTNESDIFAIKKDLESLNKNQQNTISLLSGKVSISKKYLENKLLSTDEFIKRLDLLETKYERKINYVIGTISFLGVLIALFSFAGFKKYFNVHSQLTETMNLFDIMQKSIYEKEAELHAKFDEIIGKKKEEYTTLDKANFLDYEHKLYFAQAYLPITRKIQNYKESLLELGEYWLEQEEYGRAVLRFKEIENLQDKLDSKKNFLFRILMSLGKKNIFQERILGSKTAKYFNLYGYACNACAEELADGKDKDELLEKAINYYRKSIETNKNYASPYYNLGRLYSFNLKKYETALKEYEKVFDKNPDLSRETYRNMTCSLIKQEKPTDVLIKTLDKIPDNDPYWQDVIDDEFINPKIKTTPELRSFILKKFPAAKNIT